MIVDLTPEQEAKIREIAEQRELSAEEVIREAVDQLITSAAWYKEQVATAVAQLDQGEFLTHEEVVARISRLSNRS